MARIYTHEYIEKMQNRITRKSIREIEKLLDAAIDKETAKTTYLGIYALIMSLIGNATYYEEIISPYEFSYKLGRTFDEALTEIIVNIKKKEQHLELEEDRTTAVHCKWEYYKLWGIFNLKMYPTRLCWYNSRWELISEKIFTYNFDLSLFWEFFKRGKTEQEKVYLWEAFCGREVEEIVHIEKEISIIYEEEIEVEKPKTIVRFILNYIVIRNVAMFILDYGEQHFEEEILTPLENSINTGDGITVEMGFSTELTRELPKIEWLGTSQQLSALFAELFKKNWIKEIDYSLIERYFENADNLATKKPSENHAFSGIKVNPKVIEVAKLDGQINWIGTQKQLGELFITLFQKHWISEIQHDLIKIYFTHAASFKEILRPTYCKDDKYDKYSLVFTPNYKPKFEKIAENTLKNNKL